MSRSPSLDERPAIATPPMDVARERFLADQRWWAEHYEELLERHPEQFVAIKDRVVIGANADLKSLCDVLDRDGLNAESGVLIEFLGAARPFLLFG